MPSFPAPLDPGSRFSRKFGVPVIHRSRFQPPRSLSLSQDGPVARAGARARRADLGERHRFGGIEYMLTGAHLTANVVKHRQHWWCFLVSTVTAADGADGQSMHPAWQL